jgi:NADPH:quinone reductase-like Zn-dependent oxidoreductase
MKRAQVSRFGKPSEVIELVDMDLPAPGPGEARIKVAASPINPADILKCHGHYGYGESVPKMPHWGGVEGAGHVVELGAGVTNVKVDDLVNLARVEGVWGEELIVPAARLNAFPADADPLQVAMLTVNPPTAELMLSDFVDLEVGDWVIQNAANSAVGHHVIRLAKARGYKTINVVRRDNLVAPLKSHGADVVVVDGDDLADRVVAETGGALARLGIDAVGGAATARLAACLAPGGTVVNYGLLSGEDCKMPARLVVFNDIRLRGFFLPRSLAARSPADVGALYKRLLEQIMDGTLAVGIEQTYPLDLIRDALDHAERGGRSGKILITP